MARRLLPVGCFQFAAPRRRQKRLQSAIEELATVDSPVRAILMYGLVPLWICAGLGDWLCHKRTRIESNAGVPESIMHSLMMAEVGVPVLLALFLEINAALFAVMIAGAVHAVTAWIDRNTPARGATLAPSSSICTACSKFR
jgi:hypothetical protein